MTDIMVKAIRNQVYDDTVYPLKITAFDLFHRCVLIEEEPFAGPDAIPSWILINILLLIFSSQAIIFNVSLSTGNTLMFADYVKLRHPTRSAIDLEVFTRDLLSLNLKLVATSPFYLQFQMRTRSICSKRSKPWLCKGHSGELKKIYLQDQFY
uniref:Uncharacterized protein n=1 Tax=Glossina austeni TaxID=7395 RepID=A0A1A9VXT9_GLOAU